MLLMDSVIVSRTGLDRWLASVVHYNRLGSPCDKCLYSVLVTHEPVVQVMSGMKRQVADSSSREDSTTSLAKESKQKVR